MRTIGACCVALAVFACDPEPVRSAVPAPAGTGATVGAAVEVCNGEDDDGDGVVDEEAVDRVEVWADGDGDGHGVGEPTLACAPAAGLATTAGDCDDTSPEVHPGADERCNAIDDDCDLVTPDLCDYCVWHLTWTDPLGLATVVERRAPDGSLLDSRPGCSFVSIDDDLVFAEGDGSVEVLDPETCAPVASIPLVDVWLPFPGGRPDIRWVGTSAAGDLYVLYVVDSVAAVIDRYDPAGSFVAHVWQGWPDATSAAFGGDGRLYVVGSAPLVDGGVYVITGLVSLDPEASDQAGTFEATWSISQTHVVAADDEGVVHVLEVGGSISRLDAGGDGLIEVLPADRTRRLASLLFLPAAGGALSSDFATDGFVVLTTDPWALVGPWVPALGVVDLGPCP